MERDATIFNGDDDGILTLMLQNPPTKDSLKNIGGGGGGGGDGELKAIKEEIRGLKAEKRELHGELREVGVVAIHRLEGEIERARADLGAASSAAIKGRALAEELKAERDNLVAEIASLSAAVEVKETEITALEQNVMALMEAKEEAAKASAEREDDQRTRTTLLVEKIWDQDDALMKLGTMNSSLEKEIIKLQDALSVLEGKIVEKKKKKKKNAAEATAASSGAAELGAIALWAVSVAAATVTAVYLQHRT